jgi:N-acetylglucosamine-6-phosphate deacetylase
MHALSDYVDLQVNGYADVDFNADVLDAEKVVAVCGRLRDDGVAGILATVITADLDAMCRRLANICRVREQDRSIADRIWGIHIEGPILNETPGYIGAHPAASARPA